MSEVDDDFLALLALYLIVSRRRKRRLRRLAESASLKSAMAKRSGLHKGKKRKRIRKVSWNEEDEDSNGEESDVMAEVVVKQEIVDYDDESETNETDLSIHDRIAKKEDNYLRTEDDLSDNLAEVVKEEPDDDWSNPTD